MAESDFMGPLDDLVPHAAAEWASGDLSLRTGNGGYARYIKVVAVTASPSLVLKLRNGATRTYNVDNANMAAEWDTPQGLQIAGITQATIGITAVLVGY